MTDLFGIKARHPMTVVAGRYTELSKGNGPCPLCGGTDRFYVHKDDQHCGCRQCGLKGDVLDLVRAVEGVGLAEAAASLEGGAPSASHSRTLPAREGRKPILQPWKAPDWQRRAEAICVRSVLDLATDRAGMTARAYLADRGLSPKTWKAFGLGFDHNRKAIVLPWREKRYISAIKYRLFEPRADGRRFEQEAGGGGVLFGASLAVYYPVCAVLEGEFNALSAFEAGFADVFSIGPEANLRAMNAIVKRYERVLLWMDDPRKLAAALTRYPNGNVTGIWSENGLDANDVLVKHGPRHLRGLIDSRLGEKDALTQAA